MSVVGVFASPLRQAGDRVTVDVDQTSGLSDATALGEVLEHGAGLFRREVGVEQRRALALGEAVFADLAVEQSDVMVLAVVGADGEVSDVASAVGGAIGVLATEAREVVHSTGAPRWLGRVGLRNWKSDASGITTPVPCPVFNSSEPRPELTQKLMIINEYYRQILLFLLN
jgi:hypothetical protein